MSFEWALYPSLKSHKNWSGFEIEPVSSYNIILHSTNDNNTFIIVKRILFLYFIIKYYKLM